MSKNFFQVSLLLTFCILFFAKAQSVTIWTTSGDQSKLLQKSTANFASSGTNSTKVTLNENTQYQTIDGVGYCFTEGSAQVIFGLAQQQQDSLLNDLYNPTTGIGMPVLRVALGACDLGNGVYSYDDVSAADTAMAQFSFKGVDSTYLIPVLKKVMAINPNIKILACPWSAPKWMKSNNSFIGGSVNAQYYAAYAKYFVKYVQGMAANGIPIWGVTPQNEPENGGNNPSCVWSSQQEATFIQNNLGPAFKAAGITTKIIAFDHNCDDVNFPEYVCTNASTYVDGSAFHLYAGNVSAMTTVYNATKKNVYMTEQCTCGGSFSGDMSYHMPGVILGPLNNYGKWSLEWNLATDSNMGPHTDQGGCGICDGGITVKSSTSYTHNPSYYLVGQATKVIKAGSVRIASTGGNGMTTTAVVNSDGTRGLVVYSSSSSNFDVVWNGQSLPFSLGSNSVASFLWQGPVSVKEQKVEVPSAIATVQAFPEAFAASTRISVNLAKAANADLTICNSKGAVVAVLMHGRQAQGSHNVTWNGTDQSGRPLSAGVYIVKLSTPSVLMSKRLLKY